MGACGGVSPGAGCSNRSDEPGETAPRARSWRPPVRRTRRARVGTEVGLGRTRPRCTGRVRPRGAVMGRVGTAGASGTAVVAAGVEVATAVAVAVVGAEAGVVLSCGVGEAGWLGVGDEGRAGIKVGVADGAIVSDGIGVAVVVVSVGDAVGRGTPPSTISMPLTRGEPARPGTNDTARWPSGPSVARVSSTRARFCPPA